MTDDRTRDRGPTYAERWVLPIFLAAPLLMGGQEPGKTGHLDELMPQTDPRAAPLTAARTALDAKDGKTAARHLQDEIPPVDDFRALLLARARVLEGKPDEALRALSLVEPRSIECGAQPLILMEARMLAAELLAPKNAKAAAER